jgi:predicted transcriptional regulator
MHATDLKIARARLGVPGAVVSRLAGITRSRLSDIERGNVEPTPDERQRLYEAMASLTKAKERVASVAAEVGWPLS